MQFSIFTSAYIRHDLKKKQLLRAYNSLRIQDFEDWEWIVTDDGSPQEFPQFGDDRVLVVKSPHLERIVALTAGMKEGRGEWFAFLDADDEYFSYSLNLMNQMIKKNPNHKLFNCASFHIRRNCNTTIRGAFECPKKEVGHEPFGPGNIVNGTFFFHRSLYDKFGGFPEKEKMWNPWDFSMEAQREFPEIKEFFMIDKENEPEKVARELGNPWGNDFYMFYKYTRKHHSKTYQIPIIIIHHEGKEEGQEHEITD